MKPTLRTISPRKFYRLLARRNAKQVSASRFNDETWETKPLHWAFIYRGFLYFQEKTKETNFSMACKRISLENVKEGAISYYVV